MLYPFKPTELVPLHRGNASPFSPKRQPSKRLIGSRPSPSFNSFLASRSLTVIKLLAPVKRIHTHPGLLPKVPVPTSNHGSAGGPEGRFDMRIVAYHQPAPKQRGKCIVTFRYGIATILLMTTLAQGGGLPKFAFRHFRSHEQGGGLAVEAEFPLCWWQWFFRIRDFELYLQVCAVYVPVTEVPNVHSCFSTSNSHYEIAKLKSTMCFFVYYKGSAWIAHILKFDSSSLTSPRIKVSIFKSCVSESAAPKQPISIKY